jgi:hypothetical protein
VPVVTSAGTFAFKTARPSACHGARRTAEKRPTFLVQMRRIVEAPMLGRQLRRRYGVRGPGVMRLVVGRSGFTSVCFSRYFQPRAETFDNSFQFVGPSITNLGDTAGFRWEQVWRPIVVYVSAPRNAIVKTHAPQLDVLRRAPVFVTHGGRNSPHMSEREIVGRRVEEPGPVSILQRSKSPQTSSATRSSFFSPTPASAGKLPWFARLSRRPAAPHGRPTPSSRSLRAVAIRPGCQGDPSARRAIETPVRRPKPETCVNPA